MSRQQGVNYDFVLLITRCLIFKASISTEMDITSMILSTGFVGGGVDNSGGTKISMSPEVITVSHLYNRTVVQGGDNLSIEEVRR